MKRETFVVVDAKTGKKTGTIESLVPQSKSDVSELNRKLESGKLSPPSDPKKAVLQ